MFRVFRSFERRALVLSFGVVLAGCVDLAAPSPTPQPRRDQNGCVPGVECVPFDYKCTATDAFCVCDEAAGYCCRRNAACMLPGGSAPGPDTTPRLRILWARGPNGEGSFTTLAGERTLSFASDATPAWRTSSVTWAITDDPTDAARAIAPAGAIVKGSPAGVDVPRQTTERWRLGHGAPLSARALAFKVVAELPVEAGRPALRDSTVVRQRELDVLRQEYVDFGIPVPGAGDIRTPGDVAGATRFGWAQLNQGDYGLAVLTSVLLGKLDELDTNAGRTLSLSSVFRNPAHHRFHVSVSGGFATALLSQHQYGTAVDIRTFGVRQRWARLRNLAKDAGACAEPLAISTSDHVHADWRVGAPRCPKGW